MSLPRLEFWCHLRGENATQIAHTSDPGFMILASRGSILFERAQKEGSPKIPTLNHIQSVRPEAGRRFDLTYSEPLDYRKTKSSKLLQ